MVSKICLYILIIYTAEISSQNISVDAYTDSAGYLVGDYINLTVKVEYDKGITVTNPFIKEIFKDMELIKQEEPLLYEERDRQIVEFRYIVSVYDSANISIPGIPVGYKAGNDTTLLIANSGPLSFNVRTLPVVEGEDIKDVKEPIKIPLDWRMLLLYLLIALAITALAYFLYRRYKKKQEGLEGERKIIPKVPSYVTALNSLHQLEEEKLWQKGLVKEYHSRITEIIRRYFEDRFYLPALELTTSEALGKLKGRFDTREIINVTEEFLNNADLVKFAKYNPNAGVNAEMMKQAYQIVEKTIPKERENNREVLRNAG